MLHDMNNLSIIFFGNTKYSKLGLQIVNKLFPISLVITISNSPVKKLADELNIPVIETNKLDKEILKKIETQRVDFLIVEDYGLILPKQFLDLPKYAPLNIHHSLLPKYRGPSPAPSAILAGGKKSGVTIIKMNEEVDSGDILAQKEYELTPDETTDSLLVKLNQLGAELVVEVMRQYIEGSATPFPQDHSKATFTKRFIKEDGYFDINNPPSPEILDRMIRAYYPWPGVWCKWNNKIVKFLPSSSHPALDAGSIKFLLQMEGKKVLSLKDFLNGYPDFPKSILSIV